MQLHGTFPVINTIPKGMQMKINAKAKDSLITAFRELNQPHNFGADNMIEIKYKNLLEVCQ